MGDTRLFAYVGQSRSQRWIHLLESYGFGEMVCRGEMPPRRTPWAFDNGAFKDWDKKSPMPPEAFDVAKYERDLDYHWLHGKTNPDFMVAPDLPMNGLESLRFSEQWLPKLRAHKVPVYLVLQDGMTEADVKAALGGWSGLFVGGSLPWKLRTSKQWVDFAHANGLRCHIGRMGTEARVRAAMRWGADSIDSALPLWAEANLKRFLKGFTPTCTQDLPLEVA